MPAKIGRPTKYKKKYCDQLIVHMAKGLSFEAFGGLLKVSKQTLYTWVEKHPQFLDAKKQGELVSRLALEQIGLLGMTGKIKNFNVSAWIFMMKNMHGWRDKQPDEIRDSGFKPVIIELPNKGKTLSIENEKK